MWRCYLVGTGRVGTTQFVNMQIATHLVAYTSYKFRVNMQVSVQPHPRRQRAAPPLLLSPHEGGAPAVVGRPRHLQRRHLEAQVPQEGHCE